MRYGSRYTVQLDAQNFRWSPNAAVFKIAAAAAIDQELIKGWAVWWVLSGYYLVSPSHGWQTSPVTLLHVKGEHSTIGPSSERPSLFKPGSLIHTMCWKEARPLGELDL